MILQPYLLVCRIIASFSCNCRVAWLPGRATVKEQRGQSAPRDSLFSLPVLIQLTRHRKVGADRPFAPRFRQILAFAEVAKVTMHARKMRPRLPAVGQVAFSTTAKRRAQMITLEVDGKPVEIEQGSSLIQACEKAGSTIPRFCYHDRLNIAGNCRMCLVEVSPGPPKPQASCAMPAMPGQKVKTNSPLVHKAREGVMEFLLANHPLDCPICDQGGQCDLQDQSMRYGSDRTRFHEITGKRAVEDKDLGPIVKTVMTRCIHCTRCIRFANEVAGVETLGSTGRGNDMNIGTYISKAIDSEMSGNLIDLCPVGALTSKPGAFTFRPWELKHTESVDVHDAVGSNIRVDSRSTKVMRIQPRVNDDVNEEWINDKTRYANDGLSYQRLTTPLVRSGEGYKPISWANALNLIADGLVKSGAKGNEIQAVAGHLADTESLVALQDLMHRLDSDNLVLDQSLGAQIPAHGVDVRSNYLFNTTLPNAEEADAILLIGTNPRHEAAILNTRLRKSWLERGVAIGLIGEPFDSTFLYERLGTDASALQQALSGKGEGFAAAFAAAKKPMIVVGSQVTEHGAGAEVYKRVSEYVLANANRFVDESWRGYNVLQRAASRAATFDMGWAPSAEAAQTKPKFIYLLNADDFDPSSIPKDAFVVYQGHHGDLGASYADICLPGSAYTEKSSTWVNTEGRTQRGREAVNAPGAARDDWKIVRALSEAIAGARGDDNLILGYDDLPGLRERMWNVSPTLVRLDAVDRTSLETALAGIKLMAEGAYGKSTKEALAKPFGKTIENFYRTDPISRASVTMAQCTKAFVERNWSDADHEEHLPISSFS